LIKKLKDSVKKDKGEWERGGERWAERKQREREREREFYLLELNVNFIV
jgi:hypothetical protein